MSSQNNIGPAIEIRGGRVKLDGSLYGGDQVHGSKFIIENAIFYNDTKAETTTNFEVMLPINLVRRQIVDKATEALSKYQTCILLGPVGVGKSTCASCIIVTTNEKVIWLKGDNCDPRKERIASDLLVIDDVSEEHSLSVGRSFCSGASRLIVTTTSQSVAQRILSFRGLASHEDAIIEIDGFTPQESRDFLDSSVGARLTSPEKDAIADSLMGSPIALQAMADLIFTTDSKNSSWLARLLIWLGVRTTEKPSVFLPNTGELNVQSVADFLMGQWIAQLRSEKSRRLLRILCRTSMLGMSASALAFVSNIQLRRIMSLLDSAIKLGFIRVACHHRFPDSRILVPHPVLRGYFLKLHSSDTDSNSNSRYIEYARIGTASDPLSQVDAVMAGIQGSFGGLESENYFQEKFDRFASTLSITLNDDNLPKAQLHRLSELLASTSRFDKSTHCSRIISISQSIGLMPPNMVLAGVVWHGALCSSDSWARGTAIRAAVRHWHALDRQDVGILRLEDWFALYTSRPDLAVFDPFTNSEVEVDKDTVDLDLAAYVGGMCIFGKLGQALDNLSMAWRIREKSHSHCSISHYTVLISIIDADNKNLMKKAIQLFWDELPDVPHKRLVRAYSEFKGLRLWPNSENLLIEDSPYALTIARAAHSDGFFKFASRKSASRGYYL